ncbi:syntaxin-8 isoform X1 [Hydra vulgaris]|uniref:Syntaxin-8 n=2 Tax=Hydra vulgaris TaxID=6087 RepID=T2M3C5_HYDVU|nr:syntaxin-8-like isoform X1 [Hydra vulgaris]
MPAIDSWQQDYDDANQIGQDIMELINERNSLQRTGSKNSAQIQCTIRKKITDFSNIIKSMKVQLLKSAGGNVVTSKELERRQNQIDTLISREKQIAELFNKPLNSSRHGVLNNGYDNGNSDLWSQTHPSRTYADEELTTDHFYQQQNKIIEEQDKGLEVLSKIIERQKLMGKSIGDELDYHNELIDDIQDQVDSTNQKLIRTEVHVKKVTRKTGSCVLIVVVILLLICIVTLAVVPIK